MIMSQSTDEYDESVSEIYFSQKFQVYGVMFSPQDEVITTKTTQNRAEGRKRRIITHEKKEEYILTYIITITS